ncbi:hypothetical protein [Sphingobacterium haloxyli]|uniref:Multidrug transporter n=1 Tax=Sphingobacterium haloxyli TaxID=2100533 RepID=A0A2S9J4Z6_9SPHI|nr:hypothetical protein [Sphingobacterium haloxyli]PRD47863.1 hypothetical protein C5745_08090 [Sphingobacterium haloxyli]
MKRNSTIPMIRLFCLGMLSMCLAFTSCSDDDDNPRPDDDRFELVRDDFRGKITEGEIILESGTYQLTGTVEVREGATLTIKPGVRIEATNVSGDRQDVRYIAVAQGGKINVEGTKENPVVMTATTKTPGAWGGLVICGRAPINKGLTASAEVSELTYGGTDVNDNSGTVRYLRIEYSGYSYDGTKEFNGLSMFGVGKGTTIEYVQSYEGSDDAFEWFGGTVDSRYLVAVNTHEEVADDIFDWTEGWNGTGEYWYGIRTNSGNRGIEADNNSSNHNADPISNPTIKNLTLVGNNDSDGSENQAIKMRVGTNGNFDNVVLSNWGVGFDIQHDESLAFVEAGELKATNVKFVNVGTKAKGTSTADADVDITKVFTENDAATGAGNGVDAPEWAQGWTVGL